MANEVSRSDWLIAKDKCFCGSSVVIAFLATNFQLRMSASAKQPIEKFNTNPKQPIPRELRLTDVSGGLRPRNLDLSRSQPVLFNRVTGMHRGTRGWFGPRDQPYFWDTLRPQESLKIWPASWSLHISELGVPNRSPSQNFRHLIINLSKLKWGHKSDLRSRGDFHRLRPRHDRQSHPLCKTKGQPCHFSQSLAQRYLDLCQLIPSIQRLP